jgi:hydroxycarboxylate dehydrogenase B
MNELVIQAPKLQAVLEQIALKGGSSALEATRVAANLVEANLTGHDSHGAGMMPLYVEVLLEGGLKTNQHPSVVLDAGSMLRLEGNRGYGQVIGLEAMQMGIQRAKRDGVCVLGLANSHHLGRIGQWAEQCATEGLVSLHFVNVLSRPMVAPWGGRDARIGTNPVCIGIPRAQEPPIILDFATSRMAYGKIRVAHNQGKNLPQGVLLDDQGEPTEQPHFAILPPLGAILPFGEHKGYGLALMAELLGGALAGGLTQHGPDTGESRVVNGMLSIILNPSSLGTGEHLESQTQVFTEWVLQSPPAGVERVLLPGESERRYKQERLAKGIPVDPTTWQEIVEAGKKLGLEASKTAGIAGV